jgi:hypothetical protein
VKKRTQRHEAVGVLDRAEYAPSDLNVISVSPGNSKSAGHAPRFKSSSASSSPGRGGGLAVLRGADLADALLQESGGRRQHASGHAGGGDHEIITRGTSTTRPRHGIGDVLE